MQDKLAGGRLVVTPHPVLLDGQRNVPADLRPGESLYAFLQRNVEGLDGQQWQVAIGGREVPRHLWHLVRPKDGQVIEVRGGVARSAVALVAIAALTYFTFGAGAIAGFSIGTSTALGTTIAQAAVFAAGSILINKVLAPKKPKAASQVEGLQSLSAPRNRARPYEPLGLLLGTMRIAPDLASNPYTWYEGDDQFLSLILTPGLNVHRVEDLYNGDALLSSFDGVQTYFNGFAGMPSEDIPLYSNADVIDGGTLLDTSSDPKHTPGQWVQRTSSADTIRLMVGVEFTIYDRTSKGGDKASTEQIQIQYRQAGSSTWITFGNYTVTGSTQRQRRVSYTRDVDPGQYDVRVRTAGLNTDGSGAQASFTWTTLTSVQQDTASYAGIPRIGVKMKATGQLNGAPDELRCVAHSAPIPVWTGSTWSTEESSNPGAQLLAYARGFAAPTGTRIAGMGLPDEQIDLEALKAFMLFCAANDYAYDNWITEVRSHQDVLDAIALAGFGQVTWAGGRLSVVWVADEQPLSGVVNMATIKKAQFQVDYTLANSADGIEYSYLDRTTWEAKTIRVPAPGITTMLNPAQVTGEGITSEEHAARLARWHLAQSLYQYKGISYSTDIEHLSYGRMSMLALQHDLTQWGYGGRTMAASIVGGAVQLELDEPVPAPAMGNAYIGLRIPGERVYRVLKVAAFTGSSKTLALAEPWPSDAPLPGNSADNPAWDTIWIYDFKQTPGYRVRVTGIQPENDLKGAAVTCVAEGPEFWHYVLTGEYIPPPDGSLLQTRPVASDLQVTERQVVQGNTVFTELQVSWAITGPVGDTVVLSDLNGDAELEQVARSVTRSASWRIPGAGTYTIIVRPYSPDGMAGVAASITYTTAGADGAPVLVDLFDVEDLSGGVRRYVWGFFADTIQSPDFAGVEIRYTPGTLATPDWATMTPLGADGYHAAAFEAVLPTSGAWTFACRSRNAAGTLSTGMRVLAKTLGKNLGEQQQEQDQATADLVAEFTQLAAEQQAQANELAQQATELASQAEDIAANAAETAAQGLQIAQQQSQIEALQSALDAPEWDPTIAYAAGSMVKYNDRLYSALQDVPAGTPPTNTTYWQDLGEYSSLAEQVAANSVAITSLDSRVSSAEGAITSQGTAITGLGARVGDLETEQAATTTAITQLDTRVASTEDSIEAQGDAITQLDTRLTTAEGGIATNAGAISALNTTVTSQGGSITAQGNAITALTTRMTTAENGITANNTAITNLQTLTTTQGNTITAQGNAITALQTSVAGKADASAVTALSTRVTAVENTVTSQGSAITSLQSGLASIGGDNLLANSGYELPAGTGAGSPTQWGALSGGGTSGNPTPSRVASAVTNSTQAFRIDHASVPSGGFIDIVSNSPWVKIEGGTPYSLGADLRAPAGSTLRMQIAWFDSDAGDNATYVSQTVGVPADTEFHRYSMTLTAPAGKKACRVYLRLQQTTGTSGATWLEADNAQLQKGATATQWQPSGVEAAAAGAANASAITALTTRVTNAENSITSQATSITSLTSRVDLTQQAGANIVIDGGFEGYAVGQAIATTTTGTFLATTDAAQTGTKSGRMLRTAATSSSNTDFYLNPTVRTSPGRVYYVEAWGLLDAAAAAPGTTSLRFGLNFFATDGTTQSWSTNSNGAVAISSLGAWTKISGYVTAPANASTARIWLSFLGSTSVQNAAVFLDNVVMQDVTDAYNAQQTGNANATAITALTTRVTTAENSIASQATAITTINAQILAVQNQGSNLVVNGTLENGATGWALDATWSVAAAEGRSGGACLKNVAVGTTATRNALANNTSPSGNIPVTPGRTYRWGCYYKTSSDFNGSTGNAKLRLGNQTDALIGGMPFAANKTDWTPLQDTYAVPSTVTMLRIRAITDASVGTVWVDDVWLEDITDSLANSQAISALSTTVAQQGNTITAQGTSISSLQTQVNGKADSSALTSLSNTVTAQGSQITANSNAITALQTTVAGKADASALTALSARVTTVENTVTSQGAAITNVQAQANAAMASSPNLLPNGGFNSGLSGWNQASSNGFYADPANGGGWGTTLSCGTPTNASSFIYSDNIPVAVGLPYTFTGDAVLIVSGGSAKLEYALQFVNASGANVGTTFGTAKTSSFNYDISGANRAAMKVTVNPPAGAVAVRCIMQWTTTSGTIVGIGFRQMKLECATTATPYTNEQNNSLQASATQSLTARVTTTENGVSTFNSSWQVALTAGNLVSGVKSVNNGTISSFAVQADIFSVVAPAGGARTEFSNGNWRVYDAAGTLRVRMGVW